MAALSDVKVGVMADSPLIQGVNNSPQAQFGRAQTLEHGVADLRAQNALVGGQTPPAPNTSNDDPYN
jgi:hypothetical protein